MPYFLKMDEGALDIFLIVPPCFMVFNCGFNSAWPAHRVQGRHCFRGSGTFRYGRSFVAFGFDEQIEGQRVWVTIGIEVQTQWLPDVYE